MSRTSEKLMDDPNNIAGKAEDMMEEAKGQAGEAVSQIRSRLAAALESAKVAYERLGDRTAKTAKATDRCIRDHPWETAGVALGLGVLVGVLASRK